jgi:alpha-tubulin suppressor-like RCC1 family protein
MRNITIILSLFISLYANSQQLSYDTTFLGSSGTAWNAKVKLPPTYYSNVTDSFECIIFFPGQGEQGTNGALLATNGPHAYIASGWDGGVQLATYTYYPIIISLQPPGNMPPTYVKPKIDAILSRYRIHKNSLHLTGLSQGGWTSNMFTTYQATLGDYTYEKYVRSIVNVQGVVPDDINGNYGVVAYPTKFRYWGLQGGREAGFEQVNDTRKIQALVDTLNVVNPGKSYFQYTSFGNGGHCCWSNWYGPGLQTFNINGVVENVYQWMIRQGDTTQPLGNTLNHPPVANAGTDQVVYLSQGSSTITVKVDGSGSTDDHHITAYLWTKVSGPGTQTFLTNTLDTTRITNLQQGTYQFQLKVTDDSSAISYDTVQVIVNAYQNQLPTIEAGVDRIIQLPKDSVAVSASASDPDGTIASYSWTKKSGPSTYTITSASSASTTITGLVQGTYIFQCVATDNNGATATDSLTVTVQPVGGANKYIRVNVDGGSSSYTGANWNNWNTNSSLSFSNFIYDDGSASTVSAVLSSQQAISGDNGASYGGVIMPAQVLRYASYSTVSRTLTVNGLDNSKTYNLQFAPSRASSGNTTRFIINGSPQDIVSDYNLTNAATFYSVSPTSGSIVITITTAAGVYNYINGFVITENGTGGSNQVPVANAGIDQTIDLPLNYVFLSGTSSDADGVIASRQWTKTGGPSSFNILNPNSDTTTVNGLVAGTYTFTYQAIDNLGAVAADNVNINVTNNPINQPPVINIGSNQSVNSSSTTISASVSDDGTITNTHWYKAAVPGFIPVKAGAIGSSTYYGNGATTYDSSVIGRVTSFYKSIGVIDSMYNFAVGGLYIYEGMPTGYTPPAGRPTPAVGRNTTALITRSPKPKVALVGFPSNGYDTYSFYEIMNCYQTIYDDLTTNGIETFITGTQPRPQFPDSIQQKLLVLNDSLALRFGSHYIDFFKPLVNYGTNDMLSELSYGDGIHVNNLGHRYLFGSVIAKNIFSNFINSTSSFSDSTATTTAVSNMPVGTNVFVLSATDNKNVTSTAATTVISTNNPSTYVDFDMGLGEYQDFFIKQGKPYGMSVSAFAVGNGQSSGYAIPPQRLAVPTDLNFVSIASGLHHSLAADTAGRVWVWGWNEQGQSGNGATGTEIYTPIVITTDSSGNAFNNIKQVQAYYSYNAYSGDLAVSNDGKLYIWGNTRGGLRGNGSDGGDNFKPVQITIPGGRLVSKVIGGEIILALCTDGTVWTWGGAGNRTQNLGTGSTTTWRTPTQVSGITGTAVDIAGAGQFSYALNSSGTLFGWGYYGSYLGFGSGGYASNTPVATARNLTSDLSLPHPVLKISANTISTHVILTDSTLWGWGDNACGTVGNGSEIDFSTYSPPYAWDLGPGELLVQAPVHLMSAYHDWTDLYDGQEYCFYSFARRANGYLYSWGRDKTGVLGNGIVGPSSATIATYPNSWDVTTPTLVDPFAIVAPTVTNSPYCTANPGATDCTVFTPINQLPTVSAGSNKTITAPLDSVLVTGSASDIDGYVQYYHWSQISGPNTATIRTADSSFTYFSGLIDGTYIFRLTAIDNSNGSGYADVSVTRNASIVSPTRKKARFFTRKFINH